VASVSHVQDDHVLTFHPVTLNNFQRESFLSLGAVLYREADQEMDEKRAVMESISRSAICGLPLSRATRTRFRQVRLQPEGRERAP
jgi:hypothetical protein